MGQIIGVDALVQWIVQYFTQDPPKLNDINEALRVASPVVVTDRMPIVLQHAGHSRTVIGFERNQGKISLLMFDPSRCAMAALFVLEMVLIEVSDVSP